MTEPGPACMTDVVDDQITDGHWDSAHATYLCALLGKALMGYLNASGLLGHAAVIYTVRDYDADHDYHEARLNRKIAPPNDEVAARLVVRAIIRGDPPQAIIAAHPWVPMLWEQPVRWGP